jgi:hypothetical protein
MAAGADQISLIPWVKLAWRTAIAYLHELLRTVSGQAEAGPSGI